MKNNRGQMSVFPVWPMIASLVAILILGFLQSLTVPVENAPSAGEEHLCAGVFGCGGPPVGEMILLALGIGIAAVVGGFVLRLWHKYGIVPATEPTPQLQLVKEQYVEGDIDTVLTLEDRLEDVLDDERGDGNG